MCSQSKGIGSADISASTYDKIRTIPARLHCASHRRDNAGGEPHRQRERSGRCWCRLQCLVRRPPRDGYGLISYRLLNGLSNGTRRTLRKPASAQSSRTLGSWKPSVPSPAPPPANEVVMQ